MTLVDSLPASSRPIGLRRRPDLVVCAQRHGRERYWAVKDPITLQYFHLREEEYAILSMLDGRTSLADIQRQFARQFAPRVLGEHSLHAFLATLHRQRLVLAEGTGQAEQLLASRATRTRRRRYQALLGPLAIRFRGIHPQRILDWLEPRFGWLFSSWCVAVWLILACAAMLLVTVQFDVLRASARVQGGFGRVAPSLADFDNRRNKDFSRAGPRAGLPAIWRRLSRDRGPAVGLRAVPLLQRIGFLDA